MDRLRSAIEDAIPTMPTDVCGLVGQYASETPYIWSTDGLDASVWQINGGSAVLVRLSSTYGCHGWHKIVSRTCLSDGPPVWTIDTTIRGFNIFIGVTTTASNVSNAESSHCCGDSWTFFADTTKIHQFAESMPAGTTAVRFPSDRLSIRFRIDPAAKQIMAVLNDADTTELVLMTAATDDVFWSLRPCVVFAGPASVVMSNTTEGTGIPST